MTGWLHPYDEGYPHEELTMTETQDGERCRFCDGARDAGVHDSIETCEGVRGPCLDPWRHHPFTATPDDRDREVDVDLLREAARRAGLPREVSVADIENLATEYGRLRRE